VQPYTYDDMRREFSDHATFCRESLIVQTEQRELVPMILSPGQIRLREAIAAQREQGKPVRILYLKSRRIQATTGTAAEFFRTTAFSAGVHTIVLAHDETSVQNIFSIYERFNSKYKPFNPSGSPIFVPTTPNGRRGEIVRNINLPPFRALSDRIYYEHAGDPESSFIQIHTAGTATFGRSFRITNVHFSEFPYYQSPQGTLAAVMSAVPKLPETTAVVEGTAKTIGDYFHKMWLAAIAGESEWLPIFMGWWEHPSNTMPLAVSPDRFQNSLSPEELELMRRYSLSLEQLAWRRWTIQNDFTGDMTAFRREHPATAEEAFAANSRNRFSIPHINRIHFPATALCGELEVEDVGAGEKRLALIPNDRGALAVWRRPEKGRLYVLGADCAQGLDVSEGIGECDPDWSVGQVLDRDTGEQCARLRARMMPGETGRYMARLARWYNMSQICGEVNPGGGGVSMLEAVLNADYPSALIYHRSVTADQDPQVRGDRIGWATSGVSRPILISLLDETIRQLAIAIHCPITISELMTFVIKANGKAEHETGQHDDTVIALALAMVAITRMPRPLPVDAGLTRRQVSKYGTTDADQPRGDRFRLR
jgi:hypothetical protein